MSGELRKILLPFDRDTDGRLTPEEVSLAQLATGVYLDNKGRKEFYDAIGSEASLTYEAAESLISKANGSRTGAKETVNLFAAFDTKKDGTISFPEFKAIMDTLGEGVLSGAQVEQIAKPFVRNQRLEYGKFVQSLLEM